MPLSDAHFGKHDLSIRWAANNDEHGVDGLRLRGNIKRHDHELSWDLCLTLGVSHYSPYPFVASTRAAFPRPRTHAIPSGLFEGSFRVNGGLAHRWLEGHARAQLGQTPCLITLGAIAISGKATKTLSEAVVPVDPGSSPCSRSSTYGTADKTLPSIAPAFAWFQADLDLRRYGFVASPEATLRGQVEADTSDLVGLTYNNPFDQSPSASTASLHVSTTTRSRRRGHRIDLACRSPPVEPTPQTTE